jgi:hypothetical protein
VIENAHERNKKDLVDPQFDQNQYLPREPFARRRIWPIWIRVGGIWICGKCYQWKIK